MTDRHHGFSFACATLDPEQTDVVPVPPTYILQILKNPLDRLMQQLVLVLFQSILDDQRIGTSQGTEAGAIDVGGGGSCT